MKLRPYQAKLKTDIYREWDRSINNVLAVSPTASGKTVLFSEIIKEHNGASCAIAHRQELVSQISLALARDGVRHKIIGPKKVVRLCVNIHMLELGTSYYDSSSSVAVAGVDTLVRRGKELKNWLNSVTLWIQDECFPSGTLVDNTPIEKIKIGDYVTAYNEQSKSFEKRKVTRLFKNPTPEYMVSLQIGHHVLNCTKGHPILTKEGWIDAGNITDKHKVYMVRRDRGFIRTPKSSIRKNWACVLFDILFESISSKNIKRNNDANQQKIRVGSNEEKQPNEETRNTFKSFGNPQTNRTQSKNSRWKRKTTDETRDIFKRIIRGFRFHASSKYKNRSFDRRRIGLSSCLQTRFRTLWFKISNRSGWNKSQLDQTSTTGQEERRVFEWVRVDGVTVHKRSNSPKYGRSCKNGYVYNIEVEGLHTYTADGIVVHNCHHVLKKNKWGDAAAMFPNAKGLGVTATPTRADGKGLGRHADGLMDVMVEGPTMRELIDQGYLTDYKIYAPPSDLDLTNVTVSKTTGDFNPQKLKTAVRKSHVIGDVVDHYLRIAPGKLGITFATDVETATEIAAQFNLKGVPAAVVSAKTPDSERIAILRKFKNRELYQLVNVDLFGEGFDLPAIEVVSMARPTQSYALFIQQFGRALRLLDGKTWAIIIDHVGNVLRHGLPDSPCTWSLDSREKRSKGHPDDVIPVRACLNPKCLAVYERVHNKCPFCGYKPVPAPRSGPEQVDGDLTEITAEILAIMRGEVHKIDRDKEEVRVELQNKNAPHIGVLAGVKRHVDSQEMQKALRASIAWWAGYHRELGQEDSQIYRRFFHSFGIDVMTAQSLKTKQALELAYKINHKLGVLHNGSILR